VSYDGYSVTSLIDELDSRLRIAGATLHAGSEVRGARAYMHRDLTDLREIAAALRARLVPVPAAPTVRP
jgi:hypothetical protein